MTNLNVLINMRESILDTLIGARRIMALNHSEIQQKSQIEDPAFVLRVALQDLLAGFMDEQGQINYAALKTSPAYVAFHDQTAQLQTFDPASLITRDAKLAFWINLYNMLIMDAVISL
ncbi:MAG: DUF547 domain-containing protein, partial [Bacteroidales bacterium]|nr:DUF547 domain-containing protein [Bacteroidales bacterium]